MLTAIVARQLAEGDHRFRQCLADLKHMLKTGAKDPVMFPRIRSETRRLFENMLQHLVLEEQDGYLDQVEAHVPNLHEHVAHLHDEQHGLIRQLEELHEEMTLASPVLLPALARKLTDLVGKIEEHEARKNELVMNAFNEDPGAMD